MTGNGSPFGRERAKKAAQSGKMGEEEALSGRKRAKKKPFRAKGGRQRGHPLAKGEKGKGAHSGRNGVEKASPVGQDGVEKASPVGQEWGGWTNLLTARLDGCWRKKGVLPSFLRTKRNKKPGNLSHGSQTLSTIQGKRCFPRNTLPHKPFRAV